MKNNNSYIDSLKGVFGDLAGLTPDKLQGFVADTMTQLASLREKIESSDPKVREEGIKAAQELKEVLESQMEGMAKLVGEDPAKLAEMMGNMRTMDKQDQEILDIAKEQFKGIAPNEHKKVNNKVSLIG